MLQRVAAALVAPSVSPLTTAVAAVALGVATHFAARFLASDAQSGAAARQEDDKKAGLPSELYEYACRVGTRPSPGHAVIEEISAAQGSRARMQSSRDQGALMTLLAKSIGARKAIDIGTFTGYSALNVALALPPRSEGGELITIDISDALLAQARRGWEASGVADRITAVTAPALSALDEIARKHPAGSFDFAFIDADKGGYLAQYEKVLPLIRPGGLILADNVLWHGRVVSPEHIAKGDKDTLAIRNFNDHVHGDLRVDIVLVPISDGLFICRKK